MNQREKDKIIQIGRAFGLEPCMDKIEICGGGHINWTYLITCEKTGKQVVLQRINTEIFRQPQALMKNIELVTTHLRKNSQNPDREVLQFLTDMKGNNHYIDEDGYFWRAMKYIENTVSYEICNQPLLMYESGKAFGHFQHQLADFPADQLIETIPDFHHTPKRFEHFCQAVEEDCCDRKCEVRAEIEFVKSRGERMAGLQKLLDTGKLPLRVTHNDAKLSNVLMDVENGKAVCVIDLDTVMPGLAALDYGDSLRFGACTSNEDEQDLSKVQFSLPMMEAYTKGFLEECGSSLTELELELLPEGAWVITMEQGMRFLTDYLEGDIYYQTNRPGQNLDRARVQFALVADMERQWEQIVAIRDQYR